MRASSACLAYNDIKIGAIYSFERKITKNDCLEFARLTGDKNPLHVDAESGQQSPFGRNVVHGMLAAGLFSALVGMYCPGEKSLYFSQSVNFRIPIFYDDLLVVRGTVIDKSDSTRIVTLKTEIIRDGKVVINGEAKVKVTGGDNE